MPTGSVVKKRVSGTCTIWTGPEEFRIRALVLPTLIPGLAGALFAASCIILFRDRAYFGTALMGTIALGCLCLALTSYTFSVSSKGFRTWINFGPIRFSTLEISAENLVEVIAYSFFSTFAARWYHHLQLRRNREFRKNVIDFWSRNDAVAASSALVEWLNEHRPAGSAVKFSCEEVRPKRNRKP